MKSLKTIGFSTILIILFTVTIAHANPPSDIHITPDGKFSATNVVVFQKAGSSNFFSRVTWGSAFVRVTVLAHDNTAIIKDHGEKGTVNDIKDGDVLDVEGILSASDGTLIVDATRIRDSSLQVESKTISGVVKTLNLGQSLFMLTNKLFDGMTVIVATSTNIQKGVRTISLGDILVGDKILSATGLYDYPSNTLTVSNVTVYQDKSIFAQRNFQGTLKSFSGLTLPAVLVVTISDTDYTVYLPVGSTVLSKNKSPVNLSRFVVGDTVRFFGAIRQSNLSEVDAIILRDLNF